MKVQHQNINSLGETDNALKFIIGHEQLTTRLLVL